MSIRERMQAKKGSFRAKIRARTFRFRGQETLAITRPSIRAGGGMRDWLRVRKFQVKQKLGWIRQ